tara:strand:+ start:307 stop:939 length:633 start_codon:yes stop_codon:yes gene_type:complete
MTKQLLVDYNIFKISPQMINESEAKNGGRVIVKGILQRAGAENQNGRVYPRPVLEREAKKYDQQFITQNRALGELDHPDSSVVNLANVSHNIRKIWWKNNDLMGEVEVLSTPSGNILKELLKAGILLGISSRGLGSVKESAAGVEVQDDFELVCWDFVSNPSTHGAFMTPAINESVNNKLIPLNKYDRVNTIINEVLCDLTCVCALPNKR